MKVVDIVTSTFPDVDQTKLNMAISRIENVVKDYCNRDDVPSALNFVVADMVIDYLNLSDRKESPEKYVAAKSIKEGDVSVEFGTESPKRSETSLDNLLSDYKSQLNKHRKLRW